MNTTENRQDTFRKVGKLHLQVFFAVDSEATAEATSACTSSEWTRRHYQGHVQHPFPHSYSPKTTCACYSSARACTAHLSKATAPQLQLLERPPRQLSARACRSHLLKAICPPLPWHQRQLNAKTVLKLTEARPKLPVFPSSQPSLLLGSC